MAPSRLGLEATIKMSCTLDGKIKAAEMRFWLDSGAYTDISPNMSKAIAANCSGPYNIENLSCDSFCVYTNHNYSTAFRGFSHESYMFCVERCIDELAKKCNISPLEIRLKNAIVPGNLSPTGVELSASNSGDFRKCLEKLNILANLSENNIVYMDDNKVRVKGIGAFWKAPNPSTDASAGAVITFNKDGSINLNIGSVEMGSGGKNLIAQMLAEKLQISYERVFVEASVNTKTMPKYWKTVASLSSFLVGRAVMNAADDAISQLKSNASLALNCPVEDLDIKDEKVIIKYKPEIGLGFKDIAFGTKLENGNVVGKQVIGRGSYIIGHISSKLAVDNGKGKTGNAWTVGAEAVELEVDLKDYSFKVLNAYLVIDIGNLINPKEMTCVLKGGMSMGISLAINEEDIYDEDAIFQDTSLRTYKVMHINSAPNYLVDFVQTPQLDAPYGVRAFSEHGVLGMPAAIANAISLAVGHEIDELPIYPEVIYKNLKD